MILDFETRLSASQDLLQSQASYYSTKAYDLGSADDPGAGKSIAVVFAVDTGFTSSGNATVKFEIIDEEDETLDGSSVVIASTDAIAYTRLTEGFKFFLLVPAGLITQQFIGVKYTIATADTTAGRVTADIVFDS